MPKASPPSRKPLPIRGRMYLLLALCLAAMIAVGVAVHREVDSSQQRAIAAERAQIEHLSVLEELNDYISDFRTVESEALAPMSPGALADIRAAADEFDVKIRAASERYQKVQARDEFRLAFSKFLTQWAQYRRASNQVFELARSNKLDEAAKLYRGESNNKYTLANGTFGSLVFRSTEAMIKEVEAKNATARNRLLQIDALIAAMIVVTLLCLVYVDTVILKPLTRLIRMSGNAVSGKDKLRLPWLSRGDEIGTLARSLARFQESMASLVRNQKLAAAKHTILQRALANEERLNHFQKTFRSMATHEFRTLLNVIDGHAQRLLNARHEEADSRPRYTKIREAVAKLNSLIQNWLDAAQSTSLDDPKFGKRAELSLVALLEDVRGVGADMFPNATITVHAPPALDSRMIGDGNVLFHAFINLVSNATKYTIAAPAIEIGVADAGDALRVVLRDNGTGIPEDELKEIFQMSFRSRSNAVLEDGSGVGLAVVHAAIEFHKGAIEVSSQVGVGTTFTITLPKSPALTAHAA
ncbi:MCP four helix bundle domain-containing protein [Pandoraea nosoerga]|uniref:histidine kinase n=1 Tax=Pandoraea nosoerga TaxID=2508296 RepID=A0A5E4VY58_9BURK|nr:ATP-binding protein [Pandoraea nosoerga]MBN4666239.1 MCP four helix bundle domain-containing protein [Pandoraea nosoerga]MBN4676294.1 MCP four helix bundle domain-containing protein [Pandoraea nosoerga]MBN4681331.1 MCP four helix bundle domain-containing protein [Pandoraea nosoerga]MBN4745406.1 MCP four helix bundle domain-containing protein [Pandoraea nosoerga]VVE17358.1 Sensor histidine kinase ResE [Pandoraea nosoerga]